MLDRLLNKKQLYVDHESTSEILSYVYAYVNLLRVHSPSLQTYKILDFLVMPNKLEQNFLNKSYIFLLTHNVVLCMELFIKIFHNYFVYMGLHFTDTARNFPLTPEALVGFWRKL